MDFEDIETEAKPVAADAEHPRSAIKFIFVKPKMKNSRSDETLSFRAGLRVESDYPVALGSLTFHLGELPYPAKLTASYPLEEKRLNHEARFELTVKYSDTAQLSIHNPLRFAFTDQYGRDDIKRVWLNQPKSSFEGLTGPMYFDHEHGLVAFFRQNYRNKVIFTVRHTNITDAPIKNFMLNAAWALSHFTKWIDPILMFEKNAQHYEESGRAVFEKLVDEGNKDVWFILNEDALASMDIPAKYRKRIVKQHSFRHYLYFFCCNRLIGSEAMGHALELRCQNYHMQKKTKSKNKSYVFLQHGVMYMVSLDSPQRTSFRRHNLPKKVRIVVSSEKEAQHFIDYAGFTREELVVCGLPKFDNSYQNEGADKILIMPTWRIWEFAAMRDNPDETAYVKMINRIVAAIPEELHDKIVVAPHPLFNAQTFLAGGVESVDSYDVLLRDVALLITDYSSIAYDAYYRGANVVFYWEEKDECMAHYGEPTHLMIDDDTAFGPTCYSPDEVGPAVERLYGKPQEAEYLRRYREIVEHHDGHNTDRLVAAIKDAGII